MNRRERLMALFTRKVTPVLRAGETLRAHVRKDGKVVYVPTPVSISYSVRA